MEVCMKRTLGAILTFCSLAVHAGDTTTKLDDWHTYANYKDVVTTHVHLDIALDFEHKQIKGSIAHRLKYLNKSTDKLILDTRDLDIHGSEVMVNGHWQKTPFTLADRDDILGSKLTITLPHGTTNVRVNYNSRPEASGLQWLTPAQTAGKKLPYMFSQSQAIHARSWMPIQDTPAMRVTYSADVKTPTNLRPVMSADNNPKWNASGHYSFKMPQAIPPYLIAIAAGNIHHKKMSKQTAIYSEPQMLDAAASEFEDTQAMIETTEKLFGAYRWGQYDLLILPPSFPMGGMENPRLSFITPTVLAGDKSLVSLIAHELAHSWSGNLVTNTTWRDLWLNEGFTSYVENRIMEEVYGVRRAVMEQALAMQDLREDLVDLPKADSIMYMEIAGRNPDEAFSGVPYTKGQLFLMFLEQQFGRKDFDHFLRNYFDDHAFGSTDTHHFVGYLKEKLVDRHPGKVSMAQINTWLFEPGLPSFTPDPKSEAFNNVQKHMDNWLAGKAELKQIPTQKWTVHEWLYFINNLPKDVSLKQLTALDTAYDLTGSRNNETAHAWLLLGIKKQYKAINQRLEQYLLSIGRNKLIKPLYKALIADKTMKPFAVRMYEKAREGYHPMAQTAIDKLFEAK
jgi:leukotriene-A4 hydrolase